MNLDEAIEILRFDQGAYLTGADGRESEAVDTLLAAIERVRALHAPREKFSHYDANGQRVHHTKVCSVCVNVSVDEASDGTLFSESEAEPWPCPTIAALEDAAALDGEAP